MPNLVTERAGDVLILCQNTETPTLGEWETCLEVLRKGAVPRTKALVKTSGGGPDAGQRQRLSEALGGAVVPIAIVSNSVRVRFITASVALFSHRIASFSEEQILDALNFLKIPFAERPDVLATVERLSSLVEPT